MKPAAHEFWSRIFAGSRGALRSLLRGRRANGIHDIQDIEQEVYLRLLRVREAEFANIRDPNAYLLTVACNVAAEQARLRGKSEQADADAQSFAETESTEAGPEDETIRLLREQSLTKVLQRLPNRWRAVLLMQHRDGMSYSEIAAKLGVSTHMVKKYVVKALRRCREELSKDAEI